MNGEQALINRGRPATPAQPVLADADVVSCIVCAIVDNGSSSLVEYAQRHAKGGYGPPPFSTELYNRPVRSKKIDFDVVREIALALPDVEESTIHGAPSLKVRGRLLACPAIHRSAEPNTLAPRLDLDQRKKLIADKPSVYYVTNHYVNYPTVLVRLSRIEWNPLMELLGMSWHFVSSKTKTSKRRGQN